jgi:hypothetical protein
MHAITPQEALDYQDTRIPEFVINAVNQVIKDKIVAGVCKVEQDTIVDAILASPDFPAIERPADSHENFDHRRQAIFDGHWMDFEKIYRLAGWEVEYFKPDMYETIQTRWFTFRAPKKKS